MHKIVEKNSTLPKDVIRDLQKIKKILIRHGVRRIILFGSMATGDYTDNSDIDICFEGIPASKYFRVIAECMIAVDRRISLLALEDLHGYLKEKALREGKIIYEKERA